ncbi:MAG: phosphoribosylformylglycinamidine cyclo-ligase [Candidatus Peribacteraceae bacterium]|nr:phosphoribosylformylglycinamidine cyclo-ligase [Candidatus Peribacteraceae bacterium]MDD5742158.1 phosphoribosylformylglycinamidine cyclo-ligase [Candidatus Peribacteraceae bacterium]
MTTYKDAGVDVREGDRASAIAYAHATETFASRRNMIGSPVEEKDGYGGFLDMGEYYLVVSDDSTGSKIDLAFDVGKFDTLGYDLAAMVADDAVCTGAESIAISNTIDVPRINAQIIDQLMGGLAKACSTQKIVVPAGEVAEVPGAVTRGVWSATVVGIVAKDRVLKPETIRPGDAIIALKDAGMRSNGFSLLRKILAGAHGKDWFKKEWKNGTTWGEVLLTPSIIYSAAILGLIGRFGEPVKVPVKGVAHITGGGIPSKLKRVLKKSGCGAELTDLWPPHEALTDVIKLGKVPTEEAYRTWHMGSGMLVVVEEKHATKALEMLKKQGIEAKRAGTITKEPTIAITAWNSEALRFAAN